MTTATSADQVIQAATDLAPLIREYADEAEQNLRLSTPVVDALTDAGVFRYLVPQSLGGGEGDPPGFYRMVEELGRVDGSTGWCGYIGSGGSFIGPNLSDEAAQQIWSDPRAVLAGGVFPFQPIVREAGGYRVNGQWSYVSGSTHATYLMAACILPSDESPGNEAQADPNLGFVVVPRDAVEILDTWDVLGLNGTGSHDVAIRNVLVPELFTAQFRPGGPKGSHYQGPLYRFPFTGFFAQPMGAVALGIAQGAIDSVIDVAQSKVRVGGPAHPQRAPALPPPDCRGGRHGIVSAHLALPSRARELGAGTSGRSPTRRAQPAGTRRRSCHEERSPGDRGHVPGRRRFGQLQQKPATACRARHPRADTTRRHLAAAIPERRTHPGRLGAGQSVYLPLVTGSTRGPSRSSLPAVCQPCSESPSVLLRETRLGRPE